MKRNDPEEKVCLRALSQAGVATRSGKDYATGGGDAAPDSRRGDAPTPKA